MELSDQGRRSRLVTGGLGDALARRGPPAPPGAPTLVVQVYDDGAMPAAVPARFNTHPVRLTGPDREGEPPGTEVDASRTVVVTVWGKVPRAGDLLLAYRDGGFWNAEQGGPAPHDRPCGQICVSVPCGAAGAIFPVYLRDAAVEVRAPGGALVGSGTPGPTGQFCVDIDAAGDYAVKASHPLAGTATVTVHAACTVNNVAVPLTPLPGYSCSAPCCDDAPGPPFPAPPTINYWTTVLVDDGFGAVACTSGGPSAPGPWYGAASRHSDNLRDCAAGTNRPGETQVYFEVDCSGGAITPSIGLYPCKYYGSCAVIGGAGFNDLAAYPSPAGQEDYTCAPYPSGGGGAAAGPGVRRGYGVAGAYPWLVPTFGPWPNVVHCPPSPFAFDLHVQGFYTTGDPRSGGRIVNAVWWMLGLIYGSTFVNRGPDGSLNYRVDIYLHVASS